MRDVWKKHPNDADVATLFAEAAMDLRPWNLWTRDGRPQPGTEEILATLAAAMKLDPRHPGANHLYIHAVEASPEPAKGIAAADLLRDLVPGRATSCTCRRTSMRAWGAGKRRRGERQGHGGRRGVPGGPSEAGLLRDVHGHNDHFFAYAAMMQGRSAEALKAARAMVAAVPEEFLRDYGPSRTVTWFSSRRRSCVSGVGGGPE